MNHDPEGQLWRSAWRQINEARIALGMSWRDFYREAKVSEATFRKMRTDGAPLKSRAKQTGIAQALNWPANWADTIATGGTLAVTKRDAADVLDRVTQLERAIQELNACARLLLDAAIAAELDAERAEQIAALRAEF